jgi:subtilisin-like proprotein convertase family protein
MVMGHTIQEAGVNAACDGAVSGCATVTPAPSAGAIFLDKAVYNCASLISVTVVDSNIGSDTTTATLRSSTETAPETITLRRASPGDAKYTGTMLATSAPPAADGRLSVSNGDTITARYIDADDGQGNTNVLRETTAAADCLAPTISNVYSTDVTGSTALIHWTTNEASTSVVHYGTSAPPASTRSSAALVTAHSVLLAGLEECSNYLYSVASTDPAGNAALDDHGGVYYRFTTGAADLASYTSIDGPVAIPDNDPAGRASTIPVADNRTVTDVNVTVNVTHTYDSDLTLYLITPAGTSVTLAAKRGGTGDNFRNTVFDDEATIPIASGTPPFTGSFVPETPLSAADGISSLGAWKLKAVDSSADDTGTIDNWTLTLSFLPGSCGPHAVFASEALVSDTCATGGAGNGDGVWDPGEQDQFSVTIRNDGTVPLTHVTATVVALTAGVTMTQPTASYNDLAVGASGVSLPPHFTAHVPTSIACGTMLSFQLNVTSAEGSWSSPFSQMVGRQLPGSGTALNESFASGIPTAWTVVDGGTGGASASTWTTSNLGSRSIAAPMAAPVAIVDSDWAGSSATQDEQLITPPLDLSSALAATLVFDQYFRWYSGSQNEIGDVDVRSSRTGNSWVNVLRQQGAASANPDHRTIDITGQAAGAADARVRFHYYQGSYEWYWQVDNVVVNYTLPGGCSMNVCQPADGIAKPVADGSFGTAMTCSRVDAAGTTMSVKWDVTTCSSTDHHIVYGDLATIASYSVGGGACGLGTSGSYTWSSVPGRNIWFVVVGNTGAGTEGSWGTVSGGGQRNGSTASGQCGNTLRDNSGTCP